MLAERRNRRKFLLGALGAASLSSLSPKLAGAENICRILSRLPVATCAFDYAAELKSFEKNLGYRPLQFQDAKETYLPLVAGLLSTSAPTLKSKEEFLQKSFILRGAWNIESDDTLTTLQELDNKLSQEPLEETLKRPILENLLNDYPGYNFAKENEAKNIILTSVIATGFKFNGKAFIYLDACNNQYQSVSVRETESGPVQTYGPNWVYFGPGPKTNCFSFRPVTNFRSVALHEMIHLDNSGETRLMDRELLQSFGRILKEGMRENGLVLKHGETSSFISILYFAKEGSDQLYQADFLGLEEFCTDYFMSGVCIMSNLGYTLAMYGKPNDYANFTKVLDQSHLGINELYTPHRDDQPEQILGTIALGIDHPDFNSYNDRFDFVVTNLLITLEGKERSLSKPPFPALRLRPYFPDIDTSIYDYVNPMVFDPSNGTKLGCIL